MSEVLVKEYRGNIVENVHRGSIAIVSSTGDTIAYLGDIEKQTYMRSASKPIQVLPTLLAGLHRRFNLTDEDVAMFNSSHWGSNHHIFVLEEIARKTGLNPDDMIMKPCSSTSASALAAKLTDRSKLHPRQGQSKLQHCCSGKHFSLMLLQRELTGKPDGYYLKDSPVQQQIINFISMLSQTPTYKIGLGIDGCGVPVFALPLRSIAMSYAKLMDPFSMSGELRDIIDYNFSCIHKYPEKINDYGTPSYYINQNPDLIMKDGSRGVICMAIKSMKLGITVKLEDGWTDEFQGLIIANILEQLKYDDTELIEKLRNCYSTKLYNDCGIEVGHSDVDFKLNIDPVFFEPAEEYIDTEGDFDTDGSASEADSDISDEDTADIPDNNIVSDGSDGSFSGTTSATKDYDPDKDSAFEQDSQDPDSDSAFSAETNAYDPDADSAFAGGEPYSPENDSAFGKTPDEIRAAFDRKVAAAYDKVSKATEEADDDSVIDDIISRENEKHSQEESGISEEEQRAMRNKKSILGMNVVRPSTNRTVISNPRVDPITVKLGQAAAPHTADEPSKPVTQPESSGNTEQAKKPARSSFQVFSPGSVEPARPAAQDYTNRDIKLAHIISQKKKDD